MNFPPAIIGLSSYYQEAKWGSWERQASLVPTSYLNSISGCGAIPIILPPYSESKPPIQEIERVIQVIDALVLIGGDDYGINKYRDFYELTLCEAAINKGLSILAICRGHQLLNVVCGGSLYTHIPDVVGHTRHQPAPGHFHENLVEIVEDSRLSSILGERSLVKCSHHQAIDRLGDGLRVVANFEDGIIEAVEITGDQFVIGVQWHPEEGDDKRLFEALIESTRN